MNEVNKHQKFHYQENLFKPQQYLDCLLIHKQFNHKVV